MSIPSLYVPGSTFYDPRCELCGDLLEEELRCDACGNRVCYADSVDTPDGTFCRECDQDMKDYDQEDEGA